MKTTEIIFEQYSHIKAKDVLAELIRNGEKLIKNNEQLYINAGELMMFNSQLISENKSLKIEIEQLKADKYKNSSFFKRLFK